MNDADQSLRDGAQPGAEHADAAPQTDAGAADGPSVEQLQAEIAQLKDQALRLAAETENTRRRAEREANDARAFAIQKFARDLLGPADNLARALQSAPKEAADPALKTLLVGVEMTANELTQAFERNGLKKVDPARGDRFDPHVHQAVSEAPADDVAPGAVLQVFQVGYELFGRIVRPAMVVVAAKSAAAGAYAGPQDHAGERVDRTA